MEKPHTYLDRTGRKSKKYIFVSYAHKDADWVYPLLSKAYDVGINFWYDTELRVSEDWQNKVGHILDSEDCVGTVFMFSKNTVKSDAVYKEIAATLKRGENHGVFPILIDLATYDDLLLEAIGGGYSKKVGDLTQVMKGGDRIYTSNQLSQEAIVAELKKFSDSLMAVEEESVDLRGTNYSMLSHALKTNLGEYPLKSSGQKEPISWKLICKLDKKLFFVSDYCLDFLTYDEVNNILLKTFELDNKPEVISLNVIDQDLLERYDSSIGKFIATDYADSNRNQTLRLFWVQGRDGKMHLYNSEAINLNLKINPENKMFNAGIRLVLALDDSKIIIS